MTDRDLQAFSELFEDLAFSGLKRAPQRDKLEQVKAAYFQALSPFPLSAVRAAHDHIQRTSEDWPPIARWVAAVRSNPISGLPLMPDEQARESDEAERLFYEGPCCRCVECERANVTHLNLRYVPVMSSEETTIPMRHPNRKRPVLMGEWIHGIRLRNWYRARAEFYTRLEAAKPNAMPAALVPVEPEEPVTEDA